MIWYQNISSKACRSIWIIRNVFSLRLFAFPCKLWSEVPFSFTSIPHIIGLWYKIWNWKKSLRGETRVVLPLLVVGSLCVLLRRGGSPRYLEAVPTARASTKKVSLKEKSLRRNLQMVESLIVVGVSFVEGKSQISSGGAHGRGVCA